MEKAGFKQVDTFPGEKIVLLAAGKQRLQVHFRVKCLEGKSTKDMFLYNLG